MLSKKSPSDRLGSGKDGPTDIKRHVFFQGLNWEKLDARQLKPPFIPKKAKSKLDVSNFDSDFTSERAVITPIDQSRKCLIDQSCFETFSFTDTTL